jgi:hypothetical protein
MNGSSALLIKRRHADQEAERIGDEHRKQIAEPTRPME